MSNIQLLNCDCLPFMKQCSDKQFDLAIVDPPYGIGMDGQKYSGSKDGRQYRQFHKFKDWDSKTPSAEYFQELQRISQNQIIWGGNYFADKLPIARCWIFWYKMQNDLCMGDGELAWASFDSVIRQIPIHRTALWQEKPQHPTQKPVDLYKWLLHNYAKPGDKIIDTHLGSGSIALACEEYGFDLTACEIDKEYYDGAVQRLKDYRVQLKLF